MTIKLTRIVETCIACPSQWDAWDAEGNYYYLRFRSGLGTVDQYDSPDVEQWDRVPAGNTDGFEYEDSGFIELDEFIKRCPEVEYADICSIETEDTLSTRMRKPEGWRGF